MIEPKSQFRPNPDRAIYVQGQIDSALVQRLTPQILSLQHESRAPITIYIDSPGGSVAQMYSLLRRLTSSNQDYQDACNIITVAIGTAASAAADLLTAGDYALAYPDSSILFHGGRLSEEQLTAERSTFLAQILRRSNESSAMDLSREIEFRFIFRFITSRTDFDAIRVIEKNPQMSDLDCFLSWISRKLSTDTALGILLSAQKRYGRYDELLETVLKKTKTVGANKSRLEIEAAQIKAIIDFEVRQNKKKREWSFQAEGLNRLTDDFLLFHEYQTISQSNRFKRWCSKYGTLLVTEKEADEINKIKDEKEKANVWTETVSPVLQPVWSFFIALCHTLQQGENDFLSAQDAYWLGLIDEVIGEEDLPPFRLLFETVPDKPKKVGAKKSVKKLPKKSK